MKRARKPRDTANTYCAKDFYTRDDGRPYVGFDGDTSSPAQCRRLAAWLLKAAEWLERGR